MESNTMLYPREVIEALHTHVAMCEHGRMCRDCCWLWKGRPSKNYGLIRVRVKDYIVLQLPAHRVMLAVTLRRPLGPQLACHTCDNPPCCNFWHLYPGTHKSNAADCTIRGRRPKHTHGVTRVVPRRYPTGRPPIPPPPPIDFYAIGRRIAGKRTECSIAQYQLAKLVQSYPARLGALEQGDVTTLDVPLLRAIADVLQVPVGYLLTGKTPRLD